MACGWQNSCRPWSCNYLQNAGATTYKNFLQFYAKKACKKHAGISVFPIQLLEAFILFALAVFFYIEKYKIKHFITLYISLYSISRFFTDFLRWHKTKQILTTTQIISLICIFLIILLTERIKLYEKNN